MRQRATIAKLEKKIQNIETSKEIKATPELIIQNMKTTTDNLLGTISNNLFVPYNYGDASEKVFKNTASVEETKAVIQMLSDIESTVKEYKNRLSEEEPIYKKPLLDF